MAFESSGCHMQPASRLAKRCASCHFSPLATISNLVILRPSWPWVVGHSGVCDPVKKDQWSGTWEFYLPGATGSLLDSGARPPTQHSQGLARPLRVSWAGGQRGNPSTSSQIVGQVSQVACQQPQFEAFVEPDWKVASSAHRLKSGTCERGLGHIPVSAEQAFAAWRCTSGWHRCLPKMQCQASGWDHSQPCAQALVLRSPTLRLGP